MLCLILCAGCSAAKSVKSANELPELALLASPVAEPGMDNLETNGDLVELLLDYQGALQICNGKLDGIRKFAGGSNGKVEGYD